MAEWTRSLPESNVETAPYWDAARNNQLLIQKCDNCGKYQHIYRGNFCCHCWSNDIQDVVAKGVGTVWTFTVTHQNKTPGWEAEVPYVAALIELEEGVRVVSNVINCDPAAVSVGMPVKVTFVKANEEFTLPFFEPL